MRAFFFVTSGLLLAAACVASSHLLDSPEPEIDRPRSEGEPVPKRVPAFQDVTPEPSSLPRIEPVGPAKMKPKAPQPYYCYVLSDCR